MKHDDFLYMRNQWSGQHLATDYPKTEIEYVIKIVKGRYDQGQYVAFLVPGQNNGFNFTPVLGTAKRFRSIAVAAATLAERNSRGIDEWARSSVFAILPVKVTTTPAVATISPKTETVPGKTEYEIVVLGQPGYLPVEVLSSVTGGTWQYVRSQYGHQPKRFASFSEALAVIEAARNTTKGEKAAVRPVITPATTKTTLVEETVPAKTTVELL